MEFRLLGSVELWSDDGPVDIGPPRQRSVLAALAAEPARPVPVDTLIDRVWGDQPPSRARHTLYVHIARIRRGLEPSAARPIAARITRRAGGYLLDVDPDRVDAHRFRRYVDQARDPGCPPDRAVDLLDRSLRLWRGDALADVPGDWATAVRERWQRLRLDAAVAWAGHRLRAGGADAVIDRLDELVEGHPTAEPLVAALMRALHVAGRDADALHRYDRTRRFLREELGVDAGDELRELHGQLLRGAVEAVPARRSAPTTPPPEPASPIVAPAQLPLDLRTFAGRTDELARLDGLLVDDVTAPALAAVWGTAGIGKTSLVVRWAHRVAARFPDGQLYVNLRGFDPGRPALAPAEALRGFLEALRVPGPAVPVGEDGRAALFRSLARGRRMLLVLDNARDAEQVQPLLPGAPGCRVVVTSRTELTGLVAATGALPLPMGLLTDEQAGELLAVRIGAPRLAAEAAAADTLIRCCAGLPLALSIMAARAAGSEHLPLETLAATLTDGRNGLDAFATGDAHTDVRMVFSWSYRNLPAPAARLFRLMALHPAPTAAVAAIAALSGLPVPDARRLCHQLRRAQLLAEPAPDRFSFHDLLRDYAAEQLRAQEDTEECRRAGQRLLDHYLHTAAGAATLLEPHRPPVALPAAAEGAVAQRLGDSASALAWFQEHAGALATLLEEAVRVRDDAATWRLAAVVTTFHQRSGRSRELESAQRFALAAAERLADPVARATAHAGLGRALFRLGEVDTAQQHLHRALALYEQADDRPGQARAHRGIGYTLVLQGHPGRGLRHDQLALALFEQLDDRAGQAEALNGIGWCHAQNGEYDKAIGFCRRALRLLRHAGDPHREAETWDSLGYAYHHTGALRQAVACFERARRLFDRAGDRYQEAETLSRLADTHERLGDAATAALARRGALTVFDALGHPDAQRLRRLLGHGSRLAG